MSGFGPLKVKVEKIDLESFELTDETRARMPEGYPRLLKCSDDPRFVYDQYVIRLLSGIPRDEYLTFIKNAIESAYLTGELHDFDEVKDGYVGAIDLYCGIDGKHRLCQCADQVSRLLTLLEEKKLGVNWKELQAPITETELYINYVASRFVWSMNQERGEYAVFIPADVISESDRGSNAIFAISRIKQFYTSASYTEDGIEIKIKEQQPTQEGLALIQARHTNEIARAILSVSDWRHKS